MTGGRICVGSFFAATVAETCGGNVIAGKMGINSPACDKIVLEEGKTCVRSRKSDRIGENGQAGRKQPLRLANTISY